MNELPKRLVIESKAQGPRYEKQFFMDIQEAVVKGYRLAENTNSVDCTMRNFMGYMGRAVLYLPGYEPLGGETKGVARETSSIETEFEEVILSEDQDMSITSEGSVGGCSDVGEGLEDISQEDEDKTEGMYINSLSKKKDLLAYAETKGLVVPRDMTIPSQIKKFIKDSLDK